MLHDVVSIEGSEILKNYSASNPNGFYIDARVKDNAVLPAIAKSTRIWIKQYGICKTKIIVKKKRC